MAFTERFLRARTPVDVSGRTVGRYDVTAAGTKSEDEVRGAAVSFPPSLLPTQPGPAPPVRLVVPHREVNGVLLGAYNRARDNVIHCRTSAAGVPFSGDPGGEDDDVARFSPVRRPFTGCVRELPAEAHERSARVRHMLVPERPGLRVRPPGMLPDGPVGGPDGP